jgi:hypothetical protein
MRKLLPLLAVSLGLGFLGCATPVEGALAGGALGAGLGAVVGGGEGAVIGGAAGAVTGAVVSDQQRGYTRTYYRKSKVAPARSGYYETRVRRSPSGEYYEERVWIRR